MFGDRLKEIRKEKGLSQIELGKRLEITQQSVSHFEKMDTPPKFETIEKLAAALDCKISDLLPDYLDWAAIAINESVFVGRPESVEDVKKVAKLKHFLDYLSSAGIAFDFNTSEFTFDNEKHRITQKQMEFLMNTNINHAKDIIRQFDVYNSLDTEVLPGGDNGQHQDD